jgi:DNA replication protein DnaC
MCPHCHDTYWKSVVVDGVERVVRCECWTSDVVSRLLREARVPPRFARTELETFEPDTDSQRIALRKAREFVEAFPAVEKGLLFHGPYGVGKTHLAVGVLKAIIRKCRAKGYFFETPDLLRQIRHTYNSAVEETEMGVLRPVLDAELLVLDDLGTEKTSEWVQETLGLVVNTRYNARRATVLTSNLRDPMEDTTDPNSFMFQIGARTRSRLREMCEWVEILGSDTRDKDRDAAAARSGEWPAAPDIKRGGLPDKTRGRARATLRDKTSVDLKWTGGKAGS